VTPCAGTKLHMLNAIAAAINRDISIIVVPAD
jgi:hypothetical protein